MATFGKSFNISAKVSQGTNASSGTLYTAPANAYAKVTLSVESAGATGHPRFLIDGRVVWRGPQTNNGTPINPTFSGAGVSTSQVGFVVGPGEAVTFDNNAGTHSVFITGSEFKNT